MICWLQFDVYIKSLIVILLNRYTVITALAFMIVAASLVDSKSVHTVFIALFVEYP